MRPSRDDIRNDDPTPATTCPACQSAFTPVRRQRYCTPAIVRAESVSRGSVSVVARDGISLRPRLGNMSCLVSCAKVGGRGVAEITDRSVVGAGGVRAQHGPIIPAVPAGRRSRTIAVLA